MKHEDLLALLADACEFLGTCFLLNPLTDTKDAHTFYEALCAADPHELGHQWFPEEVWAANDRLQKTVISSCETLVTQAHEALDPASQLTQEFQRLFVGPYPSPAPPYGSVYTDHDMVMFGQSAHKLTAWMREQGIAQAQDDGLPADHLGKLLMLVSYCCDYKSDYVCDLLQRHILPWSSHYLELLEKVTIHPFFQALAQLTLAVSKEYTHILKLTVESPYFYR